MSTYKLEQTCTFYQMASCRSKYKNVDLPPVKLRTIEPQVQINWFLFLKKCLYIISIIQQTKKNNAIEIIK